MSNREIDTILAEQAAELQEAIRRGEPGAERRLATWLTESRRHVRHYLMMATLDRALESVDPERQWDISPAVTPNPTNIVELRERADASDAPASQRTMLWSVAAVLVASLLLLAGIRWLPGFHFGAQQEFVTAVGEQRAVELADGSVIHLNTQSHVTVDFSGPAREVHLLSGEALFKVHHDKTRPFRVHTEDVVITAVGTEFNVYRRPDGDTQVSVLEGRVRVSSDPQPSVVPAVTGEPSHEAGSPAAITPLRVATLSAGQQARVSHVGRIATQQTTDVANLAAWRQRRLVFKSTPLPEMVAEFNRYNRTPHFELQGTDAANKVYSGIFDADDPESLVELLKSEPGLTLERSGDNVLIKATRGLAAPVIAETADHR